MRYFYYDLIADFLLKDEATILGELSRENQFNLVLDQRNTWVEEIRILKNILVPYKERGSLWLEYSIPRLGRRIDVVLLIDGIVFLMEFKVGANEYLTSDIEQVWDYALDLKNFHEYSHNLSIIPVLVATEAKYKTILSFTPFDDGVFFPIAVNSMGLNDVLEKGLSFADKKQIDDYMWGISRYAPTPTIIEAAMSLYNSHSVEDITRSDASAENLAVTSKYVMDVIEEAKRKNFKAICFVTGVPGAGKTLVGLNIATEQTGKDDNSPAVYLSGNGPLVKVLCEALTRDKVKRDKENGLKVTKKETESKIKAFIQNVHHYRDACLEGTIIESGEIKPDLEYFRSEENKSKSYAPIDHVAIFDEAQRAWTKEQTASFMAQKKGKLGFPYSEPEYLISCLDRHEDWAVIVCLVGGGQEINKGEAGISEWIESLNRKYQHWHIHVSDRMKGMEYADGNIFNLLSERKNVFVKSELHLAVSMRSFRAEKLSEFVGCLLERNVDKSRELYKDLTRYPIVLTRDVEKAKRWLKEKARGSERYGMIVSSNAYRLKPLAIDIRVQPDTVSWFLNDRDDIRSSYFLEDVATEFDIQGLELDWTCVVWDGDLRYHVDKWMTFSFVGNKWQSINKEERKKYLINAYRVLLTRARQGMVIVVPEGNDEDQTRQKSFYDVTYNYLQSIGIKEI